MGQPRKHQPPPAEPGGTDALHRQSVRQAESVPRSDPPVDRHLVPFKAADLGHGRRGLAAQGLQRAGRLVKEPAKKAAKAVEVELKRASKVAAKETTVWTVEAYSAFLESEAGKELMEFISTELESGILTKTDEHLDALINYKLRRLLRKHLSRGALVALAGSLAAAAASEALRRLGSPDYLGDPRRGRKAAGPLKPFRPALRLAARVLGSGPGLVSGASLAIILAVLRAEGQ